MDAQTKEKKMCAENPYISAQHVLPEPHTYIILQNEGAPRGEEEERTPSLLIVSRTQQRLTLAEQLLRRRAPRVVFRKRNRVDRHAPTCAVQADLDP